uniref:F-box associated domain-containing protein n=1 Tax=Leersia perrieri TaxID=77586 RepID=A0A0D9VC89_9ORYZ
MDHCNGILLFYERIANPATRQWMRIPTMPPSPWMDESAAYFPWGFCIPFCNWGITSRFFMSHWLPMPFSMAAEANWVMMNHSRPRRARRMSSHRRDGGGRRGRLFATEEGISLIRISFPGHSNFMLSIQREQSIVNLSKDKYQMIKSPVRNKIVEDNGAFHLGKSEKGVYFALLWNDNNLPQFQVWLLNESLSCGGRMEWSKIRAPEAEMQQ